MITVFFIPSTHHSVNGNSLICEVTILTIRSELNISVYFIAKLNSQVSHLINICKFLGQLNSLPCLSLCSLSTSDIFTKLLMLLNFNGSRGSQQIYLVWHQSPLTSVIIYFNAQQIDLLHQLKMFSSFVCQTIVRFCYVNIYISTLVLPNVRLKIMSIS